MFSDSTTRGHSSFEVALIKEQPVILFERFLTWKKMNIIKRAVKNIMSLTSMYCVADIATEVSMLIS